MTTAIYPTLCDRTGSRGASAAENAEHLANIEKAKTQVIIYAWPKVCHSIMCIFNMGLTSLHQDGAEAMVFEVQGGFTWLLFTLTLPILSESWPFVARASGERPMSRSTTLGYICGH